MGFSIKKLLLGKPLHSDRALHERLPIVLALPIFASDALSSVAYASETILRQFQTINLAPENFGIALGISVAIIALIIMVVVSYKEVIYAYPDGGGSYIVARENLGMMMGLIAASALLVDYVLTVAVSIADCVAQTHSAMSTSGLWPHVHEYRLGLALGLVALITLLNLRGVRESGAVFAGPSYGFIVIILSMVGIGIFRYLTGAIHPLPLPAAPGNAIGVDWLVLVRGFASGCAALTGIEAVSNGVQAFKKPESLNAVKTLVILGGILGVMFIGITYLATHLHLVPGEETIISQIARHAFGNSSAGRGMYYCVQVFTALILFLAANTAFSGFPRLASILAEHSFLPRQLANIGDRLTFNNGIIVLGLLAMAFLVVFDAEAHALLPLYTIGVFIAFTTAQAGMVVRGLKAEKRKIGPLVINAIGAAITFVVLIVIASSKFIVFSTTLFGIPWLYEGAWMALLLMAVLVWFFKSVNMHYVHTTTQLAHIPPDASGKLNHTVIVLVPARIHRGVVLAANYARSISPDAVAVHVAFDRSRLPELRQRWEETMGDMDLLILDSPYRSLIHPVMEYLDAADAVRDDDIITVVLPEFVPARWWHGFLHNATGWMLRLRLFYRRDVVLTSVRYYLDH
jgi:amino acid transporter